MTTEDSIVREEAGRLARGMLALMLVTCGVLVLCGQGSVRMAISLLVGSAFTLVLFMLMARSAVRATMFLPAQAEGYMRRGYVVRYVLVGLYVIFAIKFPPLHPLAAILPLFFPKVVLLTHSVFQRKGGK